MTDAEIDMGGGMDVEMEDDPNVRRRGRGFNSREDAAQDGVKSGGFETLDGKKEAVEDDKAARSVEGWILLVTNVHEETTEEEVTDKFADFGEIKNIHLNLDRRTGYVKGYALIEYEKLSEAKEAIHACDQGLTLMDKELKADFAFTKPPAYANRNGGGASIRGRGRHGDGPRGGGGRNRSRSPGR